MTDPDRLEWALQTMMDRAEALQSHPKVEYTEDKHVFIRQRDWEEMAQMLVQGMNAPSQEIVTFVEVFAKNVGLQEHLGSLLEILVVGSLVGRTD